MIITFDENEINKRELSRSLIALIVKKPIGKYYEMATEMYVNLVEMIMPSITFIPPNKKILFTLHYKQYSLVAY